MRSSWSAYSSSEELRALRGASVAVILGSGLAALAERGEPLARVPYERIPRFGATSVEGHPGFVSLAKIEGTRFLLFAGRFHAYEGFPAPDVVAPVTLAAALGCRRLIVTNAAGSLSERLAPGSWMLATDVVPFPTRFSLAAAEEPLGAAGPARDRRGRDAALLSERLSTALAAAAGRAAVELARGVLCWTPGPTYETAAEGGAASLMGADAVAMSSLPELLAARRESLEAASLSWITNFTAHVSGERTDHRHVVRMGAEGVRGLGAILSSLARAPESV